MALSLKQTAVVYINLMVTTHQKPTKHILSIKTKEPKQNNNEKQQLQGQDPKMKQERTIETTKKQ